LVRQELIGAAYWVHDELGSGLRTGIDIRLLINFGQRVTVRQEFRTIRKKSCYTILTWFFRWRK